MALTTQAEISNINFEINSSLQVGDNLYWNPISQFATGGFTKYQNTVLLGEITSITTDAETGNQIIGFNYSDSTPVVSLSTVKSIILSGQSGLITFQKNIIVNNTRLKGYYASVKFVNNDYYNRNELFSVNSEVSISSK